MTQITPTLYALVVPSEAVDIEITNYETIQPVKENFSYLNYNTTNPNHKSTLINFNKRLTGYDYKYIGLVTTEGIDFDCACLFDITPKELRAILESKGLQPTNENKILIIEKI